MRYLPATEADRQAMLEAVGIRDLEELFTDIPSCARADQPLDVPGPLSEWDLLNRLRERAAAGAGAHGTPCFLGGGAYHHFIPAVVDSLTSRSEFVTAYTPYQPEVSQGTLQGIFEFQTMICQLTGMDVANASMYDGASATAEAVLMAGRISRKGKVLLSAGLHPRYRQVVETYTQHLNLELRTLPLDTHGRTDTRGITAEEAEDLAALVVQSPNYLGVVEDLSTLSPVTSGSKACLVAVVAEAMSLGLLKPPGQVGADIVCGEAQSFGLPLSLGGPYLGFFAARQSHLRNMPGRVVGQTVDGEGRRGYVLTLSTREQHIRRARATSNICTNQGLMALRSTVYLSALGASGLAELARRNHRKAAYLWSRLQGVPGVEAAFESPFFNEFALRLPIPVARFRAACLEAGILAGIDLEPDFPDLGGCILLAATECNTREEMDRLVEILEREVRP